MQIAHPSQWAEAIHLSGLFAHIISYVLNEEVCSRVFPIFKLPKPRIQSPALQTTQFLYVLARIIIADSKIFMQLLSATASSTGAPDDSKLMSDLMDVWWARVSLRRTLAHIRPFALTYYSLTIWRNLVNAS